MLCPFCLQEVKQFKEAKAGNVLNYTCPQCNEPIPLRYVRDYNEYPPVIFPLIGLRGHGKTCYLASLFLQLEEEAPHWWEDFSCSPVDDSALRIIREKQAALKQGNLPDSTPVLFPRPVILQLTRVPELGNWHLLAYDIAGETFNQVEQLQTYGGYLTRSPVVVWLVSLLDLDGQKELMDFTVRYTQALLSLGGNPKSQELLLVLGKGDEIINELPPAAKKILQSGNNDIDMEEFYDVSQELGDWLENNGYANFVREAKREFKNVEFTVVSALGAKPQGRKLLTSTSQRQVLAPLIYLIDIKHWELKRKILWEKTKQRFQKEKEAQRERQRQEEEKRQRQKDIEARLKPITSLNIWNPYHWFKLLYLSMMWPDFKELIPFLSDAQKRKLDEITCWLMSTLSVGVIVLLWLYSYGINKHPVLHNWWVILLLLGIWFLTGFMDWLEVIRKTRFIKILNRIVGIIMAAIIIYFTFILFRFIVIFSKIFNLYIIFIPTVIASLIIGIFALGLDRFISAKVALAMNVTVTVLIALKTLSFIPKFAGIITRLIIAAIPMGLFLYAIFVFFQLLLNLPMEDEENFVDDTCPNIFEDRANPLFLFLACSYLILIFIVLENVLNIIFGK